MDLVYSLYDAWIDHSPLQDGQDSDDTKQSTADMTVFVSAFDITYSLCGN